MSRFTNNRRRRGVDLKRGYTLLEMLIVLSIIALIAALVGPRLFAQFDRSKVTAAHVQAKSLKSALDTMELDIGRYPTDTEGLDLLVKTPDAAVANWHGPYLSGAVPKDPWGRPYIYQAPKDTSQEPHVISYGADGKEGGSGNDADVVE
jgi:general secretion pathway protein G